MKRITGWITPSRKFIECSQWEHLDAIENHKEFTDALGDWYYTKMSRLENIKKNSQELIRQGEHPEWHTYEMAMDDIRYELREKLYEKGFLRIGTKGNILYFEGKGHGVKNLMQKCKDFADEHEMACEFETRK